MTFLADENFPWPSIQIIRNAGFKVLTISELSPGVPDSQVMELASQNNAVILTFDKDYGELIFKEKVAKPPAVIFFRYKGSGPTTAGTTLLDLLNNSDLRFENTFTVFEKDGIRQRFYQIN